MWPGPRLAMALLLSAATSPAHAQDERSAWLEVEGTTECPGEEALRGMVETLLERDLFTDEPARASRRARVSFERVGRGWRARVALEDATGAPVGSRAVDTPEPDCARLEEALALVLALALDVDERDVALSLPAPPAAAAPPPIDERPPEAVAEPTAPPPAPRSDRSRTLGSAIGVRASVGRLADPLLEVSVALEVEVVTWLALEVAGAFAPPATAGGGADELERWVLGGEVRAGVPFALGDVCLLVPRVGVGAGRFEARATGAARPSANEGLLLEVLAGVDARFPASGAVGARVRVELGVPLLAHRLTVEVGDGARSVYEAPPVFGRLSLEVSLTAEP